MTDSTTPRSRSAPIWSTSAIQMLAGQRPRVDQHAVEDVELHVAQHVLGHADPVAVEVVDRRALLEGGVGDGRSEVLHGGPG